MTRAPGTKKKTAAITHRLIEELPLWPAAAIQRGPSTVAMLNSSTSQNPMVLRSSEVAPEAPVEAEVMELPGQFPNEGHSRPACGLS